MKRKEENSGLAWMDGSRLFSRNPRPISFFMHSFTMTKNRRKRAKEDFLRPLDHFAVLESLKMSKVV